MRRDYYMPKVAAARPPEPAPAAIADELQPIVGREAIAATLKISLKQLDRLIYADDRRPTSAHEQPPIRKIRGLGLVADRAALLGWWTRMLRGESAA
jgi:hypothetical protein